MMGLRFYRNPDYNPHMTEKPYPIILFDWGGTVMYDDAPDSTVPMAEWAGVRAVEGIADVLADLHTSGRQCVLATGAMISDESQIRGALARAGLDSYFSRVYCFKNTHLPKGEAFYRHILVDLDVPASDVVMVGDFFEKDVRIPNSLDIFAVWFNQRSDDNCNHELHTTVHSMYDLRTFFRMFGK
jgi:FMN phosphatase YigB (HAD superfamily)